MPSPPSEKSAERPMNVFEATLWAIGSVVAFATLAQTAKKLLPGLANDTGVISLCQIVAYVALLWLLKAVYFPATRSAVIFGTHAGSWVFYPIAALLGVAVHIPADGLYEVMLARWPDAAPSSEILQGFSDLPLWRKVGAGVGLMITTPLIEEALFRGALFGTLRRHHGQIAMVITTAAIFAFVHIQPQAYLPIAIVGAVLAFMRVASGSLWPGVLLHMTFNAVTFYAITQGGGDQAESADRIPAPWMVAGTVVTVALVALADVLRKRRNGPGPELPPNVPEARS